MHTPLTNFLEGTGGDHRGRILADILKWNDVQLEDNHDYIQWLFPLPEESRAVPFAPVMGPTDKAIISSNKDCQKGLELATAKMASFFGLEIKSLGVSRNDARIAAWCSHRNHNFLRMTRILRSLSLLGKQNLAEEIIDFIAAEIHPHYTAIDVSMPYWTEAIKGEEVWPPAHLA